MKLTSLLTTRLSASLLVAFLTAGVVVPQSSHAAGGATDPIPGTSKSSLSGGGTGGGSGGGGTAGGGSVKSGGNKSAAPLSSPTPAPAPAPAPQPIVTAPLTFTAAASVNGVIPLCTGTYRIDPYYPTLSLMTVDVQASSMNVPDGAILYITVNLSAGAAGYPTTTNAIVIAGQAGTGSLSEYVTLGATIQSVVVTDATGAIISAGQ